MAQLGAQLLYLLCCEQPEWLGWDSLVPGGLSASGFVHGMGHLSVGWDILQGEESWCLCYGSSTLTLLTVTAPTPELGPLSIPSSNQGFSSERLYQELLSVSPFADSPQDCLCPHSQL